MIPNNLCNYFGEHKYLCLDKESIKEALEYRHKITRQIIDKLDF